MYGFGLGVYESDYYEPEEPECDECNVSYSDCICPPEEISILKIPCAQCGREFETIDEGEHTERVCGYCTSPSFGDYYEPPF